jgi:hypothetical protein
MRPIQEAIFAASFTGALDATKQAMPLATLTV